MKLPPKLEDKLTALAEAQGVSRAEIIRQCIVLFELVKAETEGEKPPLAISPAVLAAAAEARTKEAALEADTQAINAARNRRWLSTSTG